MGHAPTPHLTAPHFPYPRYYAIVNHADDKPAIVFVPSAKQAQLTAVDLLTYATADDAPKRFMHGAPEDVAPFLRQLKEGALAHVAAYGIGFLHEGLGAEEQAAVLALHAAGALQVLVVVHSMCWTSPYGPCMPPWSSFHPCTCLVPWRPLSRVSDVCVYHQ